MDPIQAQTMLTTSDPNVFFFQQADDRDSRMTKIMNTLQIIMRSQGQENERLTKVGTTAHTEEVAVALEAISQSTCSTEAGGHIVDVYISHVVEILHQNRIKRHESLHILLQSRLAYVIINGFIAPIRADLLEAIRM